MVSPIVGDLRTVLENDETFKYAVDHGHTWLILPDSIPDEAVRRISKWYNEEQKKNNTLDEVEMIHMCLDILEEYLSKTHAQQTVQLSKLRFSAG